MDSVGSKPENNRNLETNVHGIEYLYTIDFKSLSKTVFTDHLATISDNGKNIGELNISVEETIRNGELCYHVHAQSHGEIEGVAMGTSIIAYIARGVVTLEQSQHEYIKIPDKPLDKKTVIIKEDNNYIVRQTINEGLITHESCQTYPTSLMRGFISEGANIILQRIMVQRQQIPENAMFTALDSNINLAVMKYLKLPNSSISIDDGVFDIFGIKREVTSQKLPLMTWTTYFLSDGEMVSREALGSSVRMQLLKFPKENVERRTPSRKDLMWEEDMQLQSHFIERKEELVSIHQAFINGKPEIRALLSDFCQFVLLRKPDDVYSFAAEYFRGFSTKNIKDVEMT
ncbi:ciliogenesis-associated TTC17-interacting protein isoform X1 [Hydra vulgaris]|uniref:ciliogenesis-associated TTC17-interacting protein isoform X1 n=1 Tax=Hydra vulgaris TaxID=6087 RepID=UPI000640D6EF|nr:ciliogenesis-associated TTC17-interacting protein isoform X1 [Hydra vulgaris]XP_012555119.1 ciliogenesis-associated TTC17-interacting protein isoform X1 [Hydra vulgaris]